MAGAKAVSVAVIDAGGGAGFAIEARIESASPDEDAEGQVAQAIGKGRGPRKTCQDIFHLN